MGEADTRLVAVVGKGGVGKTAVTAMLSRVLRDRGRAGRLLLIDADPAGGLTVALGASVRKTMGEVREEIIAASRAATREEKQQLGEMIDYMVLEALTETPDYALLSMGRSESRGCFCPVNSLLRGVIEALAGEFDILLIDGEAGVEQINRQVMRRLDTLVIVSDATSRGLQTAGLVRRLVEEERVIDCARLGLVLNRVQGNESLVAAAASKLGVEVLGFVPQDERVAYHDLVGRPLDQLPADSPALAAVRAIAEDKIFAPRS